MVDASSTLREQQFAFARHLRDPAAHPPPSGIEDRRLAIYRELFYNTMESLLAGNFPVIRRTLDAGQWHAVVRAFRAGHRCQTPLFTEIGREFIRFLEARSDTSDPSWLAELAHYEWVELALQIAEAAPPAHLPDGDLLDGIPVLSPTAWALAYRWPVQRIGPDFRPDVAPASPTLLLVRRDPAGIVRFAAISPLVYRMLELLDETTERSGRETLLALSVEADAGDPLLFVDDGARMLERLRDEGTIIGIRPASNESLSRLQDRPRAR